MLLPKLLLPTCLQTTTLLKGTGHTDPIWSQKVPKKDLNIYKCLDF